MHFNIFGPNYYVIGPNCNVFGPKYYIEIRVIMTLGQKRYNLGPIAIIWAKYIKMHVKYVSKTL